MTLRQFLSLVVLLPALTAAGSRLTAQERSPPATGVEAEDLPAAEAPEPASLPSAEPSDSGSPTAPAPPDEISETAATSRYAEGDLAGAQAIYDALSEHASEARDRARFALNAAWLAWQLGDRAGGLTRLEAALFEAPDLPFQAERYSPDFVSAYYDSLRIATHRRRVASSNGINRGVAAMRAGDPATARRELVAALALVPDDPDGVYNLALLDYRDRRQDEALAGFERVLALERGNPEGVTRELKVQALNNAGVIQFAAGRFDDAETSLAEAVRLSPNDPSAWFNLGLTRQKLGRDDSAYEALQRARALAPGDVPIARALALTEIDRKGFVAAVALLVESTQAKPDDPDLWFQLGRAQRGLGNLSGAAESLRRAIRLDSGGAKGIAPSAALLLADTLRSAGDPAGSAEAASQLLALRPDDPDGAMYLGLARLASGDAAGAVTALESARRAAPSRADIAHNLGSAYVAARDFDSATKTFEAALALDPSNDEARQALEQLRVRSAAAAPAAERKGFGAQLTIGDYPDLGLRGLRVDSVTPGSPAARAGLRAGDLILRCDGRAVASGPALERQIRDRRGASTLAVLRGGATVEVQVRLD